MSNVLVDKTKIDLLANAIADKSGEPITMTLDEMVEAVDGIEVGGGGITPTGNIDITQSGVTDVTNYATATVPSAELNNIGFYYTSDNVNISVNESGIVSADHYNIIEHDAAEYLVSQAGWINEGATTGAYINIYGYYQLPSQAAATITPTESAQTAVAKGKWTTGAVTVSAIPSNYVGSGIAQRSSSDLTASGATITVPSGYYASQATKSVASGTAGTPTATKGTVSNHSISVTPSVTNTTGYITGGTKTGTAVTVSASELVSGSQTITENGTVNVTNLAEVVVDVRGTQIGTATATAASPFSVTFTGITERPTSWVLTYEDDMTLTTGATITSAVYDGAAMHISLATSDTGVQYYDNDFVYVFPSYSPELQELEISTSVELGTLGRSSTYKLVYTYGGSKSDIQTSSVQVGSGATSITFPVSGRPTYWSLIFKADFGTSSGYQRVITVANDGTSTYGLAMDTSVHALTSWSATYSGGNFTITSQGTNNGGYFHQPGYYQLTYYVDPSAPSYQTKAATFTPTTQTQTQSVTADSGYDALDAVNITVNPIPSQYVVPTGNLPITANANNINVANYATVSVNVPTGGSSKIAQTAQSTTRATSTSYTELISLTCTKTGTYDVYWSTFRSSTSGTWGSQLYLGNTAYGTAQTGSWSNHIQNIHLSNVQIDANEEVSVRVRSRGNSYYGYVGTLTIIEA